MKLSDTEYQHHIWELHVSRGRIVRLYSSIGRAEQSHLLYAGRCSSLHRVISWWEGMRVRFLLKPCCTMITRASEPGSGAAASGMLA